MLRGLYPLIHFHHVLPLWFLVVSLFLPRVALFVGWLDGWILPFGQLGAAILWVVLPRVLVLFMIYQFQGLSLWFLLHLLVAITVWTGGTHRATRYRNR